MLSRDIWIRHAIRVTPDSLGYPHQSPSPPLVPAVHLANVRPNPQKCRGYHGGRGEENYWSSVVTGGRRRRYIIEMIRIMFYHGSRRVGCRGEPAVATPVLIIVLVTDG